LTNLIYYFAQINVYCNLCWQLKHRIGELQQEEIHNRLNPRFSLHLELKLIPKQRPATKNLTKWKEDK
jgi:hypothetical protein